MIDSKTLDITQQLELLYLYDALKAARAVAFRASYTVEPERRELITVYEEANDLYEGFCKHVGRDPEPVFDARTYVPNPDRWV